MQEQNRSSDEPLESEQEANNVAAESINASGDATACKKVIDCDADTEEDEGKKRKEMEKRSNIWQHFTEIRDNGVVVKGKCKYYKREIQAHPVFNVASESAFSTSGRILDDFRTSLTPFMVEALVCTQDWLRRATPTNIAENAEELAQMEEELTQESKDKAILENNASKSQVHGSKATKSQVEVSKTTTTTTTKNNSQPIQSSKTSKIKVFKSKPT